MYKYRVMLKDRLPYLEKESETDYGEPVLDEVEKIVPFIEEVFPIRYAGEEHMVMLCLNGDLRPVSAFEVSHGSVKEANASPREIFKMALLGGAEGIVLAHNHPTGDIEPSNKDRKVERDIRRSGKILDIELLDFLIFGDETYSAFEKGEL